MVLGEGGECVGFGCRDVRALPSGVRAKAGGVTLFLSRVGGCAARRAILLLLSRSAISLE
jgi:hypothetical protein